MLQVWQQYIMLGIIIISILFFKRIIITNQI